MWLSSVKGSRKGKKTFLFIYCGRKSMQVLYIELLAFFLKISELLVLTG